MRARLLYLDTTYIEGRYQADRTRKLNSSPQAGTTYVDSTVQSGTTYYYVVTAVSSSGAESSYSNQATAVVPTP